MSGQSQVDQLAESCPWSWKDKSFCPTLSWSPDSVLGFRGRLLWDSRLTVRLLGLGLHYGHRLWEDLFGEALEEPGSRTLPHLGEERERMVTWQPNILLLPSWVPIFNFASLSTHMDTRASTLFLPVCNLSQFLFNSHNIPDHSTERAWVDPFSWWRKLDIMRVWAHAHHESARAKTEYRVFQLLNVVCCSLLLGKEKSQN